MDETHRPGWLPAAVVPDAATFHPELSDLGFRVFVTVLRHAGADLRCTLTQAEIGRLIHRSGDRVRAGLHEAASLGLLSLVMNESGNRRDAIMVTLGGADYSAMRGGRYATPPGESATQVGGISATPPGESATLDPNQGGRYATQAIDRAREGARLGREELNTRVAVVVASRANDVDLEAGMQAGSDGDLTLDDLAAWAGAFIPAGQPLHGGRGLRFNLGTLAEMSKASPQWIKYVLMRCSIKADIVDWGSYAMSVLPIWVAQGGPDAEALTSIAEPDETDIVTPASQYPARLPAARGGRMSRAERESEERRKFRAAVDALILPGASNGEHTTDADVDREVV